MKNYKYILTIAYDGTNYFGWQIQKEKITIQETLQKALKIVLKEKVNLIGAGRTDAKVHALKQVAHFISSKLLDLKKILHSLNCILPDDIKITSIKKADKSFHARYSAKSKVYRYYILKKDSHDPFLRNYAYKFFKKIDIKLLKKAIKYLIGTHNFSSFANKQNEGSAKIKPIKTIYHINLQETENNLILEFEADGFLYKMVRNIVGTLLEVACRKKSLQDLKDIIKAKDRKKASSPVPGHGLFLVKVNYNNLSGISSKDAK